MNLNLLNDVKISKIAKSDNGVVTYSYDSGVTWYTTPQSREPIIRNSNDTSGVFSRDGGNTWYSDINWTSPISNINGGTLNYSYDGGVTWFTTPREPIFITGVPNIQFSSDNSVDGYIDFEFTEQQYIFDIDFDFKVGGSPILTYQYSIDGINYYDFEYFKVVMSTPNPITDSDYNDTIFMKTLSGNKYRYTMYGKNDISSSEYLNITRVINQYTHKQVFTNTTSDIITYLHSNRSVKFLRIKLDQMDTSTELSEFRLMKFDILSKKVFTDLRNVYDISFIVRHLYRQRYFSTYTFIPSVADNFLKLLSYKEPNV